MVSINLRKDECLKLDRGLTDLFRFLSCLLVAGSHYSQYYINSNVNYGIIIKLLSTQGGYLGVAVFFLLSGYGLMSSMLTRPKKFMDFIKRRVKKVYLPAVIVSLVWIILLFIMPQLQPYTTGISNSVVKGYVFKAFIDVFLFRFCDSVLWFIKIIIILSILLYWYAWLYRRQSIISAFLLLIIGSIATMVFAFYNVGSFAIVSIPLFSIGAIMTQFGNWFYKHRNIIIVVGMVILTILFVVFYNKHIMVAIHGLINYVIILILVRVCSSIDIRITNISDIFSGISYELYLTHKKLLILLEVYAPTMPLVYYLMIAILFAYIVYYIRIIINGRYKYAR